MLSVDQLILFLSLALVAEILGTVGGFGSSIFFVPLATFFFDFHSVLGITAIFHLSSNVTKIILFKKGINKRVLLYFGIPSIVFVILGAWLSKFVDPIILQILLSIFLVVMSILLIVYRDKKLPESTGLLTGSGLLSGFVAGLMGTGGAIRGLALSAMSLGRDAFIATSALIDLGIDFSRSVVYFMNGYVHLHDLYLSPMLLVVSVLGSWIGKLIVQRMSENQFRLFVLILIAIIGVGMGIKLILPYV